MPWRCPNRQLIEQTPYPRAVQDLATACSAAGSTQQGSPVHGSPLVYAAWSLAIKGLQKSIWEMAEGTAQQCQGWCAEMLCWAQAGWGSEEMCE